MQCFGRVKRRHEEYTGKRVYEMELAGKEERKTKISDGQAV